MSRVDRVSRRRERPFPHLVTEIPGPKARAHVAFDEAWTSPSLPRAYPIVPVRGAGLARRGHRRQPVPRLRRRHRRQLDRPRPPARRRRDQGAGRELLHYSRLRLLPADLRRGLPASSRGSRRSRGRPGRSSATRGAEAVEAAIKLARHATGRPYIVAFLGGFHGRTLRLRSADGVKAKYHARLRPAAARRLSRAVRQGRGPAMVRRGPASTSLDPRRRGRGDRRRADPGRGRLRRARGRLPRRACASCATEHGILLVADEVQSGVGRTGKMWAVEHWDVEPDILLVGQGHRHGHAARRDDRPGEIYDWGPGAHGSTYGGNPVALRRGAGDDRAARGRPRRQRRDRGEQAHGRPARRCSSSIPGSSATSAARA